MKKGLGKLSILGRIINITLAVMFILIVYFIFGNDDIGSVLIDSKSKIFPLTIQNFLIILFFIAMGSVFARWQAGKYENELLKRKLLPEEENIVLTSKELGPIHLSLADTYDSENGYVPMLADNVILQFQISKSVEQSISVLNSNLELLDRKLELKYSFIKYISWLIPTVGFIGTVVGISGSLSVFKNVPKIGNITEAASSSSSAIMANIDANSVDIGTMSSNLALAFNTTFVALLLSAILLYFTHIVEKREEDALVNSGSYVLKNLIGKLYK